MLRTKIMNTSCDIALVWLPQVTFGDNTAWVEVQAWWRQAITRAIVGPGARPTKHISIEFEIRWKFRTL